MRIISCAVFVAVSFGEARAQLPLSISNPRPERTDTTTQFFCRAAASVLQTVTPEQAPDTIREQIAKCEVSGPAAMAREWSLIQSTGPALVSLAEGSRFVRDERIFAALQSVAIDQSRPDAIRIVAMALLANYAVPLSEQLVETSFGPHLRMAGSAADTIAGDQPVVGDIVARVNATLQSVNDSGVVTFNSRPGPVRRAIGPPPPLPTTPHSYAGELRPALNDLVVFLKYPVNGTNVTLTYVCGNRFRIRNATTSTLSPRIQGFGAGDTVDVISLSIPPARGTGDFTETFFDSRIHFSVVLMTINGEQGWKASGNTTCAVGQ